MWSADGGARMVAACALVLAIGCSSSSSHGGGPDVGADSGIPIPTSSAGQRLAWVLASLDGAPITNASVTANCAPAFIDGVGGSAQIILLLGQLSLEGPWTLVAFEGTSTETALTAVVRRADGEYWRIPIAVDPSSKLVVSLYLVPAGDLDPKLSTAAGVDAAIAAVAPRVNWYLADVSESACTETHSLNRDSSLAIGSTFKLWVLAALADSIATGARAWTDTLAIQDAYKSLPSGTLQNQPDGTLLPLSTFATNMVAISDNTAADHLLFTLGRDSVESMLTRTAHHDPTLNQPFLATREMFDLKLMLTPAERQAFAASTVDRKRTLLAGYDQSLDPRTYAGPAWTAPIAIDQLEWFATPADLCNAMRVLKAYADQPETSPVYAILSNNPGLIDATSEFSYIGYKGGSEPGVLSMSWLLQRASDSKWVFATASFNDSTAAVDEGKALYIASALRALAGK